MKSVKVVLIGAGHWKCFSDSAFSDDAFCRLGTFFDNAISDGVFLRLSTFLTVLFSDSASSEGCKVCDLLGSPCFNKYGPFITKRSIGAVFDAEFFSNTLLKIWGLEHSLSLSLSFEIRLNSLLE